MKKKLLSILFLSLTLASSKLPATTTTTSLPKKVIFEAKKVLEDWGIGYKVDGGKWEEVVVPPTSFKIQINFNDNVIFSSLKPKTICKVTRDGSVVSLSADRGMPVWEIKVMWGDEKYWGFVRFVEDFPS